MDEQARFIVQLLAALGLGTLLKSLFDAWRRERAKKSGLNLELEKSKDERLWSMTDKLEAEVNRLRDAREEILQENLAAERKVYVLEHDLATERRLTSEQAEEILLKDAEIERLDKEIRRLNTLLGHIAHGEKLDNTE